MYFIFEKFNLIQILMVLYLNFKDFLIWFNIFKSKNSFMIISFLPQIYNYPMGSIFEFIVHVLFFIDFLNYKNELRLNLLYHFMRKQS
jgi:hypothetical protein